MGCAGFSLLGGRSGNEAISCPICLSLYRIFTYGYLLTRGTCKYNTVWGLSARHLDTVTVMLDCDCPSAPSLRDIMALYKSDYY